MNHLRRGEMQAAFAARFCVLQNCSKIPAAFPLPEHFSYNILRRYASLPIQMPRRMKEKRTRTVRVCDQICMSITE